MFSLYFIQISPSENVLNSQFPNLDFILRATDSPNFFDVLPENNFKSDIVSFYIYLKIIFVKFFYF